MTGEKAFRICQFGAGRIGQIHAENTFRHHALDLVYVVDVVAEAAETLADRFGARAVDADTALNDPSIDAVLIASATDTHAELIEKAAAAGKAIFCEKPIDLDMARVDACLKTVDEFDAALFVGFNRRFDPSFAALKARVDTGDIGAVEIVSITSRDPGLPPVAYLKSSGGLFRDMMIHDLDMARWILGEEPAEVFAYAQALVDPTVSAVGDVDTAVAVLKTASGRLAQINNSRRAAYGYDQRVEVFGSQGAARAENRTATSLEVSTATSTARDNPLHFFLERYEDAYRLELDRFVDALNGDTTGCPTGYDGRMALHLAEALAESHRTGRPVTV